LGLIEQAFKLEFKRHPIVGNYAFKRTSKYLFKSSNIWNS